MTDENAVEHAVDQLVRDEIERLLPKDADEVFEELWNEAPQESRDEIESEIRADISKAVAKGAEDGIMFCLGEPPAPDKGKRYFNKILPQLEKSICTDWHACSKLSEKRYADEGQLVAVLCDVLAASVSGVPLVTVAVLVTKVGVKRFCSCD